MDVPRAAINWRILCAALSLSFVFGSIHAFAVLLPALETDLQTGRASVSLAYSFAIVSLTGGVYAYPRICAVWSPRQIALVAGYSGAIGLIMPALFPDLTSLYLGYGLLFGFSNGVIYMLFLDQAQFALKPYAGFAVGLATAFYGLGSAGFALVLGLLVQWASLQSAWILEAVSVVIAGIAGYFAMDKDTMKPGVEQAEGMGDWSGPKGPLIRLWAIYLLSASGGLMVIVHSAEIVLTQSPAGSAHLYAPSINALGNIAGCIVGGWLADRVSARMALTLPQILVLFSGIVLLSDLSMGFDLIAVALIGLGYGALISIMPTAVRRLVGDQESPNVFKKVFTAWGAAGLVGPSFAGLMFDKTGGYSVAIALSFLLAATSLGLIYFLDRSKV